MITCKGCGDSFEEHQIKTCDLCGWELCEDCFGHVGEANDLEGFCDSCAQEMLDALPGENL